MDQAKARNEMATATYGSRLVSKQTWTESSYFASEIMVKQHKAYTVSVV